MGLKHMVRNNPEDARPTARIGRGKGETWKSWVEFNQHLHRMEHSQKDIVKRSPI